MFSRFNELTVMLLVALGMFTVMHVEACYEETERQESYRACISKTVAPDMCLGLLNP